MRDLVTVFGVPVRVDERVPDDRIILTERQPDGSIFWVAILADGRVVSGAMPKPPAVLTYTTARRARGAGEG